MRNQNLAIFALAFVLILTVMPFASAYSSYSYNSNYDSRYRYNSYDGYYGGFGDDITRPGFNSLRLSSPRIYGLDYPNSGYSRYGSYGNYRGYGFNSYSDYNRGYSPSYYDYDSDTYIRRGYDGSYVKYSDKNYRSNSYDFDSSVREYKSGFYRTDSGYVRDRRSVNSYSGIYH